MLFQNCQKDGSYNFTPRAQLQRESLNVKEDLLPIPYVSTVEIGVLAAGMRHEGIPLACTGASADVNTWAQYAYVLAQQF